MVFQGKVSDFIDCHLPYGAGYIQNIYDYIREKKRQNKKKGLLWMKNSIEK